MDQSNLEQTTDQSTMEQSMTVNPPEECLIPLEVVKNLLVSGDLARSDENKRPLKPSEELLRHIAAGNILF
jgi:hypothetical protein